MSEFSWQPAFADAEFAGGWAVVHCQQGFLADSNGVLFPRHWIQQQVSGLLTQQYLGQQDGQPVYVLELFDPEPITGCSWYPLRHFLSLQTPVLFSMLNHAQQVGNWAREHRFCGQCGARTVQLLNSRCMRCESCEKEYYTRLAPSMITLVTRGDEILLARSARSNTGMFSTLAGFVEACETVEQCVVREVREEVGLEIAQLRYISSQSWPFPNALMLGFHAEYAGGEIVPEAGEIAEAHWFDVRDLPQIPPQHSISRYLIDLYVAQRLGLPEPLWTATH